jgi:hypothetical protein
MPERLYLPLHHFIYTLAHIAKSVGVVAARGKRTTGADTGDRVP